MKVNSLEEAQFIEYILKRINKKDIIRIPKNSYFINKYYLDIKNTYESIQNLDSDIIENELNKIISNLYNINDNDLTVIDNFLAKY
jgi:hypothetical protein